MAGLPHKLCKLLLRHIIYNSAHDLLESALDKCPDRFLAVKLACIGRLKHQFESVISALKIFSNVCLYTFSFMCFVIIKNNGGCMVLPYLPGTDVLAKELQEPHHVVLIS